MDKPKDLKRRAALKGIAAAAVTAVGIEKANAWSFFHGFRTLRHSRRGRVLVFRLQSRRSRACRACKEHHKYIVGRTREAIDNNRAHVGCNCPIVMQEIRWKEFYRLFPHDGIDVARLPRY